MASEPHILVVGAGSAGKRHARNLRDLGCRITVVDPRTDRVGEALQQGSVSAGFATLDAALGAASYDGFVIASPPSFHVEQMRDILREQSRWILCEKPLSVTADEARRLGADASRVLLGYTYRWWPPIQRFRARLQQHEIGALRGLRFVMSANLADWHPWERYQDFFMAQRQQGGGALLDESHFIDLLLWMAGMPSRVYAHVDKISNLQIDSDDSVDILASYPDGLRVNMHLDLIGRPHERSITAVGEEGTLAYSYERNAIQVSNAASGGWAVESFQCERNEMFVGAARELVALVRGEASKPSCSYEDGLRALDVVDACRRSAVSGSSQELAG